MFCLRFRLGLLTSFATLYLGASASAEVVENQWPFQQPVEVTTAGLNRLDLPLATLEAARSDRGDVRLLSPDGRETPLVLLDPIPPQPAALPAQDFDVEVGSDATVVTITTGTTAKLARLELETPTVDFLKGAFLDISADAETWTRIATGQPLFRRNGASQLEIDLDDRSANFLRLTLDDRRSRPLPVTGIRLQPTAALSRPPVTETAQITRREEFANETVITLALPARHLSVRSLELATDEPLFTRSVRVETSELSQGQIGARALASGTVFRLIANEGDRPAQQLTVPVRATIEGRELTVHLTNGDSPSLAVSAVTLHRAPVHLVFNATHPGTYRLLVGQPQIAAPHYDLTALREHLRSAPASTATIGPIHANPDFQAPSALPDVPLVGASLDPYPWRFRRAVTVLSSEAVTPHASAHATAREIELDLNALAHTRSDLGDLRLFSDGHQIPYLVERTPLSRAHRFPPVPAADAKRPSVSRWTVTLPVEALPVRQIELTSSSSLFERQIRIYQTVTNLRGYTFDSTVAAFSWSHRPDDPSHIVVDLNATLPGDTLIIETDNGDNPPITLDAVRIQTPVTRIVFASPPAAPLELLYGNGKVPAPRYDLALLADRLLTAQRSPATLGEPNDTGSGISRRLVGRSGGPLLWGSLALVVIVLLVVMKKLLPTPLDAPDES